MIGSGTPSNHKSAPRPKPMTTSNGATIKFLSFVYKIISKMMRLTGTPSSQSRIGIAFSYRSLVMCGLFCRQVPFPIAQTPAFYGGETCRQRASEHRCD